MLAEGRGVALYVDHRVLASGWLLAALYPRPRRDFRHAAAMAKFGTLRAADQNPCQEYQYAAQPYLQHRRYRGVSI